MIGGKRNVDNNSEPAPVWRSAAIISAIAIIGLIAGAAPSAWCRSQWKMIGQPAGASAASSAASYEIVASSTGLVQDDNPSDASGDDDKDVPPKLVDKYTNAYKAMQKDHTLTADQAAAAQGLTIAQFRSIEGRIERDDTLRERVRKALRNATPGAKESSNQ